MARTLEISIHQPPAALIPQDGPPAHGGPYVTGDTATVLIPGPLGDPAARQQLEACTSPADTFNTLNGLFPLDKHLGGPVDYGVYLIGRMAAEHTNAEFGVPDFNLDSDRGYGWKCWDWDRHAPGSFTPGPGDPGEWVCFPRPIRSPEPAGGLSLPATVHPSALLPRRHGQPAQGTTTTRRHKDTGRAAVVRPEERVCGCTTSVAPSLPTVPDAPDICKTPPPAPPAPGPTGDTPAESRRITGAAMNAPNQPGVDDPQRGTDPPK